MASPYTAGILLAFASVICLHWGRGARFAKWIAMFSLLWFYVWSSGFLFNDWGRLNMQDYPPRLINECPDADAIVDLGGGIGYGDFPRKGLEAFSRHGSLEIDIEETNCVKKLGWVEITSAGDRAWFSAELWKAGKAPIVIPSALGCEKTDRVFLMALGVAPHAIVVENRARNTEENAKYVQELLLSRIKDRKPKALVVTSVWHMRRAMLMFNRYAPGVEAIPAPADFEGGGYAETFWRKWIPSLEHFQRNVLNWHEWLGYWGYRLFRK